MDLQTWIAPIAVLIAALLLLVMGIAVRRGNLGLINGLETDRVREAEAVAAELGNLLLALAGVLATGLALKLSLRADVSWAWSWQPLQISLAAAVAAAIACLWLPPRLCAALALLLLLAQLYLLNQAAIPVYHDWMLSTAMRADFRRFYGMAQWLGWCWPWLALLLLARRTLKPPR